jgi:uncharacterized protein YqeY
MKEQIQEAMKAAMRAHEKQRLAVIRLMLAAIKQYEVDERKTADDAQVTILLDKMLKQRRESIEQYEKAQREDLAAQERYEIELIQTFLPKALSAAEIDQLINTAISTTGAKTMQDMGKVMAHLKPQLVGRADMSTVSSKIKERLA